MSTEYIASEELSSNSGTVTVTNVVTDVAVPEYELSSNSNVFIVMDECSASLSKINGIPTWLNNIINSSIQDGVINIQSIVDNLELSIAAFEDGITTSVTTVETAISRLDESVTNISSSVGLNTSDILNVKTTYASKDEAATIAATVQQSNFEGLVSTSATIADINTTIVNNNEATATYLNTLNSQYVDVANVVQGVAGLVDTGYTTVGLDPATGNLIAGAGKFGELTAAVDGITARITTQEDVTAGYFHEWNGTEEIKIGMIHTTTDGTVYQYYGGTWDEGYLIGWKRLDKASNDTAVLAKGWAASASKLITDPTTGEVTGWEFADGSYTSSTFKISADNILMTGTTTFLSNGSNISLLNNDMGYTDDTTANNAYSLAASKTTLSEVQQQGYVLPSGVAAAVNSNTTTIDGSKITTGTIYALQIAASAITASKLTTDALDGKSANFYGSRAYGSLANSWCIAGDNPTTSGGGVHGQGYDYGVVGKTVGNYIGVLGHNGVTGVQGHGSTYGVAGFGGTTGVFGSGTTWGFYTDGNAAIGGTSYPFTAGHISFTVSDIVPGDIIYISHVRHIDIANSLAVVTVTSTPKDTRVFGVCASISTDVENIMKVYPSMFDENGNITPEFEDDYNTLINGNYVIVLTNSIGEGLMQVCDEGGDIINGDFICSSSIAGKGMKQDDDLLHNYTVAKAMEDVIWANEPSNVKLIACTYHCG